MIAPAFLIHLCAPWKELYDHSKLLEVGIPSIHVASLLLGGGIAVSADRSTLRALKRPPAERAVHLEELGTVHRTVLTGLGVSFITGIALLASDLESFLGSWVFWTKMALVALLLLNGLVMTSAERALRTDSHESHPAWTRLERVALVSFVLWFATTVAGVALRELT